MIQGALESIIFEKKNGMMFFEMQCPNKFDVKNFLDSLGSSHELSLGWVVSIL